jgi:hypothetical protein
MNGYSQKGILHNGAFLLTRLTGLVVTDSKNVKILKYRNETKILHGLAEKTGDLVFHMEKFRKNCTFSLHLKSKKIIGNGT